MASILLTALTAGPVAAQDPFDCADPVVDAAGVIDAAAVDAAWSGIDRSRIGPEAKVLVRVWDTVPDADLAAAVDEVVAVCAGDPDLGIAADAVVLGLAVGDGRSDVLVGGAWTGVVSDAGRFRTEVLGPPLADGDVTGGLVAALDNLADGVARLAAAADPADEAPPDDGADAGDQTGEDGADAGTASEGEVTIASEPAPEPTDDSGGGSPFAVALGVLGLGACGGAALLVNRRRTLAQDRARLGRKVEPALARLRVIRERHRGLLDRADIWATTSAGRTRNEIVEMARQAEEAAQGTDRAAGLLHRAIPDGVQGASRTQSADGQEQVAELLVALEANAAALDQLAALGAHLDHLDVAVPAKAEMLSHELPEVRDLANQRVADGWNVGTIRERLTAIQTTIGEATEADAQLEVDLLDLSDRLERAEASLFSIDHELQHLPDRPGSLERWSERLDEAAEHEHGRAEALRRQIVAAALVHAAESWRWAAEHPDGAIEALERAEDHQELAMEELLPVQRFDDAGVALDAAGLELMVADDLLDQVDDLLVDLDRARVEAPTVVAQLDHAVEMLEATIARFGRDLSPALFERRAELIEVVTGLRTELAKPKPNFIRVVETGEDTDRAIDELLVQADAEHQHAEARRRELDRQRARAERALARARRALGWQLFSSSDGAALDRLEQELGVVPADVEAAIERAAEIADAALRLQEQIIARRRRRGTGVTIGSGPPILGGGWTVGGQRRRSSSSGRRSGTRSSGGRSFGGRRRSSGGRSFGSRRSTGRF